MRTPYRRDGRDPGSRRSATLTARRALAGVVILLCARGTAYADSWEYLAKVTTRDFEFGKSKIVLETDARKNQQFPDHKLSIYLGGELVARYRNVAFDQVHASADNRYFVGLSNRGIPGTAFVVFDADGNLVREVKHRFMPDSIYTERSVTLARVWFDGKDPAVEFKADRGRLHAVSVRGSNGTRFELLMPDLGLKDHERKKPARR